MLNRDFLKYIGFTTAAAIAATKITSMKCICQIPNTDLAGRCFKCEGYINLNTQLPAETLEEIELKAEHEAALQFHPVYSPDQNTACRICYRNGAKEYATKLHEVQQENEELKRQNEKLKEKLKLACSLGRNYNPKK